jgi:hypothetical protein
MPGFSSISPISAIHSRTYIGDLTREGGLRKRQYTYDLAVPCTSCTLPCGAISTKEPHISFTSGHSRRFSRLTFWSFVLIDNAACISCQLKDRLEQAIQPSTFFAISRCPILGFRYTRTTILEYL